LADGAVMQGSGNERPRSAGSGNGVEVADGVDPAGGVNGARSAFFNHVLQAPKVRTTGGTHAIETHGNEAIGPMRSLGEER